MVIAGVCRISFIMLNNGLLKVPRVANSLQQLQYLPRFLSLGFVLVAYYLFLNEKLNLQQVFGAFIVLVGVTIMMK